MNGGLKVGGRVTWNAPKDSDIPVRHEGRVLALVPVGDRQVVAVADQDGVRHALLVKPADDRIEIAPTAPRLDVAVALAEAVLAGREPPIPVNFELNSIAAALVAVHAAPAFATDSAGGPVASTAKTQTHPNEETLDES
ncbi:MAG: hypothetical protein HKM95_11725 [Inquilinus sp.]|nr:hypothetical protein [Inquilinus sp.]